MACAPDRPVVRIIHAVLLCLLTLAAGPASSETLFSGYHVPNGRVRALEAFGTTLYVGGDFTSIGIPTGALAEVDPSTGALIPGFPRVEGIVDKVISDGAGGFYIAGRFGTVGGKPKSCLAHVLSDNTVTDWAPVFTDATGPTIFSIVMHGTTLYVGGKFETVDGLPRKNLAAIDLTTGLATSWAPVPNSTVNSLVVAGATLYVGGSFTQLDGNTRNYAAAFNAVTGQLKPWAPGADYIVRSFLPAGDQVYLAGEFHNMNGLPRMSIAQVDTATGLVTNPWSADLPPDATNSDIMCAEFYGSSILAGGNWLGAFNVRIANLGLVDLATGAFTTVFGQNDGVARELIVSGSTAYVSGQFTAVNGIPRVGFAAVDLNTLQVLPFNPSPNRFSLRMANDGSRFLVGGLLSSLNHVQRNRLAAIDLQTGLVTPWNPDADRTVRALKVRDGVVYAGGHFTSVNGTPRVGLAAIDAATGNVTGWNPGTDGAVWALAFGGTNVYAGGFFHNAGGQVREALAEIDLTTGQATTWNPQIKPTVPFIPLPTVNALDTDGSTLFVGGNFDSIGGVWRGNLAAIDVGTGALLPWNPYAGGGGRVVHSLMLRGNTVFVGGEFDFVGGLVRSRVGAVSKQTGLATPWNPGANGNVLALASAGGAVYAGGTFSQFAGESRARLAGVDFSSAEAIAWSPSPNDSVYALELGPDVLCVGGSFTETSGMTHTYLGIYTADALVGLPSIDGPSIAQLEPSVPNPFGARTAIRFSLTEASDVTLEVYDAAGRRAATLIDHRRMEAGPHRVDFSGGHLRSGLYFCRLKAGDHLLVGKLVRVD